VNRVAGIVSAVCLTFVLSGCDIWFHGVPSYVSSSMECFWLTEAPRFSVAFKGFSPEDVREINIEQIRGNEVIKTFTIDLSSHAFNNAGGEAYYLYSFEKIPLSDSLRITVRQQTFVLKDIEMGAIRSCNYCGFAPLNKCGVQRYSLNGVKTEHPPCDYDSFYTYDVYIVNESAAQ